LVLLWLGAILTKANPIDSGAGKVREIVIGMLI
jgi:hypothetical protein